MKLVFVTAIIALPGAWFSMHKWLNCYPSQANISWPVFVDSGLPAIALL